MNKLYSILGTGLGFGLFVITVSGCLFSRFPVPLHSFPVVVVPPETMGIGLSVVLTAASLFVILRKDYGPKDKHWAYATIGTILGFWLRGPK
jgi:hypothetical protein